MSFRINTNTQSALALGQLNRTTSEIGQRQLRLATGSRINSAADDSAGLHISNKLTAQTRGQAQALSNIGDAKSMLTVAEGALGATMDILQTMKEKAVQAGNDSMGASERTAIQNQINALTEEANDILSGVEFNGKTLFDDAGESTLSFHVGDKAGDVFKVTTAAMGVETLGIGDVADADAAAVAAKTEGTGTTAGVEAFAYAGSPAADASQDFKIVTDAANTGKFKAQYKDSDGNFQDIADNLAAGDSVSYGDYSFKLKTGVADGQEFAVKYTAATEAVTEGDVSSALDVSTAEGAAAAITTIDAAIERVNVAAAAFGDTQNRLDFKAQNLETAKTNYEAANSRIKDADFAREQMEIVKLQILQQTGSAMFAQSNAAPQSVLSFF